MKKIITIVLLVVFLLMFASCRKETVFQARNLQPQTNMFLPGWSGDDSYLEQLIAQMTLVEKIGQMTQAERSDIKAGDISRYALGSVLSGGGSAPARNTPEGWYRMVNGFINESMQTRLRIPVIYGIDAVHGHNNALNAVIFPHNVGLGAIAAGDLEKGRQAAYAACYITAQEMIATGIRMTFAPVLGVPDDIRWGRAYECYGENVEIISMMGECAVRGLQDGGVSACIKHFIGEGQTLNGRNQGNAYLDRAGIERLLPPYRAAIDAGAMAVMISFSSVNGIKMHEHKELITGLLKEEMGFKGMVLSDWDAVRQVSGGTYKNQIANAVNAGIDMVMATNGRDSWESFIRLLTELVEEGTVPMPRIDDAVLRILRFKQSAGILDTPSLNGHGSIGAEGNRSKAREIASDSLVLLRNENNVIDKLRSYKNILVAGQGANDIGMQCGGWTITWQGLHGASTEGTTILKGIQEAVKGNANVTYSEEGRADGKFDAVIAVIGEDPYAETEGDRENNINIRGKDMDMLRDVYSYGCPVIVIMLSGRPMTIGNEYENWDAFIAAWLPGTEGGCVADVLFGSRDFTGRTPYTWRKSIDGEILYPFAFGLSKYKNQYGLIVM
ncbi:MAG: glycoside hydrolase family 3 C-terminal domain-containing protein [Treponema sp.]|nr:glycoside hydrolase family 3 C-terminal domain-containing protein [Treponema sp.]